MKEELLNSIKEISEHATLEPPNRVWNRLEYKLDRFEFEKKQKRTSKLVYISSVAAVFIIIISIIGLLKNEKQELDIFTNSRMIFIDNQKSIENNQVNNIRSMNSYYSKIKNGKYSSKLKLIKVNLDTKG